MADIQPPYVFREELDKRVLEVAKEYEEYKRKEAERRKSVSQEKPSCLIRLLISVLEKLTAFLERTQ